MSSLGLPFTLRPLDPAVDFEPLAELLRHAAWGQLSSAEQLRDSDLHAPPDRVRQRIVAVDASGALAGVGDAMRDSWMPSGRFLIDVVVAPGARGQGLGSQMYADAEAFACEHGARELEAEVPENSAQGQQFAQRRGFLVDRHMFESVLDLTTFDETPHRVVLDAAAAAGIRFFSLAEAGNTLKNQRKLYELNRDAAADNPGNEGQVFQPFERFKANIFDASWFQPEGQILAVDGDCWAGLSAINYYPDRRMSYNLFTGVARAYRGRGLAQALKLIAIRRAREWGAETLRTHNDSHNQPMLAVNRKLGYKPEPGYYRMRKVLD